MELRPSLQVIAEVGSLLALLAVAEKAGVFDTALENKRRKKKSRKDVKRGHDARGEWNLVRWTSDDKGETSEWGMRDDGDGEWIRR